MFMKRKTGFGLFAMSLFAVVLATSCFTAPASAKVRTGEVPVSRDYTELEVRSAIDVTWSETASVITLTADEAIYDYVVVQREGSKLKIYVKNSFRKRTSGSVKVVLPASNRLDEIELSGASSFSSATLLSAREMDIELSGASHFAADLKVAGELDVNASGASKFVSGINAGKLSLELSGASEAELSGTAGKTDLELSGASALTSKDSVLVTGDTECEISGASNARISCTGRLWGVVSGASSIRYGNGAASVNVKCNGASTARPE